MSPILDLVIIDKSATFVKVIPSVDCSFTRPQLVNENHLIDLLESSKIERDKSKNLFSFKIKAIDTKFLKDNIINLPYLE